MRQAGQAMSPSVLDLWQSHWDGANADAALRSEAATNAYARSFVETIVASGLQGTRLSGFNDVHSIIASNAHGPTIPNGHALCALATETRKLLTDQLCQQLGAVFMKDAMDGKFHSCVTLQEKKKPCPAFREYMCRETECMEKVRETLLANGYEISIYYPDESLRVYGGRRGKRVEVIAEWEPIVYGPHPPIPTF